MHIYHYSLYYLHVLMEIVTLRVKNILAVSASAQLFPSV